MCGLLNYPHERRLIGIARFCVADLRAHHVTITQRILRRIGVDELTPELERLRGARAPWGRREPDLPVRSGGVIPIVHRLALRLMAFVGNPEPRGRVVFAAPRGLVLRERGVTYDCDRPERFFVRVPRARGLTRPVLIRVPHLRAESLCRHTDHDMFARRERTAGELGDDNGFTRAHDRLDHGRG